MAGTIPDPPKTVDDVLSGSCALLLWDLQNGLAGQSPRLGELSPVWRTLRDAALEAGVPVLRSRHLAPPAGMMDPVERWRVSRRTHGENRPDHYMHDDGQDAAWISGFEPLPGETVIEKGAPSLFHNTRADFFLRGAGVQTLIMAGVATEIGIDFTARHAMACGYFPVVVEDAVASFTPALHEAGMAILRTFTFVTDSEHLVDTWRARGR